MSDRLLDLAKELESELQPIQWKPTDFKNKLDLAVKLLTLRRLLREVEVETNTSCILCPRETEYPGFHEALRAAMALTSGNSQASKVVVSFFTKIADDKLDLKNRLETTLHQLKTRERIDESCKDEETGSPAHIKKLCDHIRILEDTGKESQKTWEKEHARADAWKARARALEKQVGVLHALTDSLQSDDIVMGAGRLASDALTSAGSIPVPPAPEED